MRARRPAAIGCGGATLLARVFSSDLGECVPCGGRLRIVAALTDPASIRTYLEGGRVAADAPAEGPRLSRCSSSPPLTCLLSTRRRAYGGVCPQRSLAPD